MYFTYYNIYKRLLNYSAQSINYLEIELEAVEVREHMRKLR